MQLNLAAGESVQSARTARIALFVKIIDTRIDGHNTNIQKKGKKKLVNAKEDFFVPTYQEFPSCFVSEGGLRLEHQGIYKFIVEL